MDSVIQCQFWPKITNFFYTDVCMYVYLVWFLINTNYILEISNYRLKKMDRDYTTSMDCLYLAYTLESNGNNHCFPVPLNVSLSSRNNEFAKLNFLFRKIELKWVNPILTWDIFCGDIQREAFNNKSMFYFWFKFEKKYNGVISPDFQKKSLEKNHYCIYVSWNEFGSWTTALK